MKHATLTILLLVLAGCSPLQLCLADADQQARDTRRALREHQQNLSRGYAIERVRVPVLESTPCAAPGGGTTTCTRWDYDIAEIRHPIDRGFERERIALLERQLTTADRRSQAAQAQCRASYPEG